MTKPQVHSITTRRAALRISAACALCLLLVFGALWPAPASFAASGKTASDTASSEEAPSAAAADAGVASPAPSKGVSAATPPAKDDVDNVVVEAPSADFAPEDSGPPSEEPASGGPPELPATPSVPDYDNAWPIGLDEAAAVVAELWDDGTFVIDGAGGTLAFASADEVPWLAAGVAENIKRVVFADAVEPESLAHWFEGCANLAEIANVPATAKDLTRAFFDCPKLAELPDDFALANDAVADEAFGFTEAPRAPLETVYRGASESVLAYSWAADGRALVNPDAPAAEPDGEDDPSAEGSDPPVDKDAANGGQAPEDAAGDAAASGDKEGADPETDPGADPKADPELAIDPGLADDADIGPSAEHPATDLAPTEEAPQVNITVPSSVTMGLGQDGLNSATIPALVANRSERAVAITGARLKRGDVNLPGGSWSLTAEGGATTFVQDARFTPLGLEVTFERPVVLAAGDTDAMLVWHGSFTDYGMKTLLEAALAADNSSFVYGSMIWIVSAA